MDEKEIIVDELAELEEALDGITDPDTPEPEPEEEQLEEPAEEQEEGEAEEEIEEEVAEDGAEEVEEEADQSAMIAEALDNIMTIVEALADKVDKIDKAMELFVDGGAVIREDDLKLPEPVEDVVEEELLLEDLDYSI